MLGEQRGDDPARILTEESQSATLSTGGASGGGGLRDDLPTAEAAAKRMTSVRERLRRSVATLPWGNHVLLSAELTEPKNVSTRFRFAVGCWELSGGEA
jgi:hypothetical protein